jgi:hypothetical protein
VLHEPDRACESGLAGEARQAPEEAESRERSLLTLLVAECLQRLEEEGALGVRAFCRAHPAHAREVVHRIRLLADHGLL